MVGHARHLVGHHLPDGQHRDVRPEADTLLLFLSHLEHEVLDVGRGDADDAEEEQGRPPRCAITQWFQDLAPPLLASTGRGMAPAYSPLHEAGDATATQVQPGAAGVT